MKQKILCIIWMIFIISGCSNEKEKDITSIAENGIEKVQPPQGCPIVNVDEYEIPFSWEYNKKTDDNQNTNRGIGGIADVGDTIYSKSSIDWLCYYDKNNMSKNLLCGKPDCEHLSETCNATIHGMYGLQYYNGYLYIVQYNESNINLKKISLDGSERETVGNLLATEKIEGNTGGHIKWIIHRGYIYYYYKCGSGEAEDTYYLNNSNCVHRMNLDTKEKECIMVFPSEADSDSCTLKGIGSYIYMNMPSNESEGGFLYRFNTETCKLEKLESLGKNISGYAVYDDRIYYLKNGINEKQAELYCFYYEDKKSELIEIINSDTGEGNLYCDTDFIYVQIIYENVKYIRAYSKAGEHITDIYLQDLNNIQTIIVWAGTDDERVYFDKSVNDALSYDENIWGLKDSTYNVVCYIEKNKLLNGDTTIEEFN